MQVSVIHIAQSGWQRALHCGVEVVLFVFLLLNTDITTVTCYRSDTGSHGLSVSFLKAAHVGYSKATLLPGESMYLPGCGFTKYLSKVQFSLPGLQ